MTLWGIKISGVSISIFMTQSSNVNGISPVLALSHLAEILPPASVASDGQGLRCVYQYAGGNSTQITEMKMLTCQIYLLLYNLDIYRIT